MAKTETFSVSKKGMDGVKVSYSFPESVEDPRWQEIVSDCPADVNALAVAQFRVRIQAAGRDHLEDGAEAVQKACEEFVYNQRRAGSGRSRTRAKVSQDTIKKGKFSKEQLALLAEAGFTIEEAAA